MGLVSRRQLWLKSMDVVSGCGCKEIYRFPHIYERSEPPSILNGQDFCYKLCYGQDFCYIYIYILYIFQVYVCCKCFPSF